MKKFFIITIMILIVLISLLLYIYIAKNMYIFTWKAFASIFCYVSSIILFIMLVLSLINDNIYRAILGFRFEILQMMIVLFVISIVLVRK